MIEYKVGVELAQEYVVYQINYDEFKTGEWGILKVLKYTFLIV